MKKLKDKKTFYLLTVILGFVLACSMSCKTNKMTSFQGSKDNIRNVPDSVPNDDDLTSFSDDIPDSAVTKGSFTVWTEPEDPAPYQNYYVVVQVNLSSKTVSSYSKSDLTGTLVGTDKYQQRIGRYGIFDFLRHYPDKGYARLKSFVPGSYENVRDDITISSELLNETQTISIVF